MLLQYIILIIISLIPYYLSLGVIISLLFILILNYNKDEELNTKEITFLVFLYPLVIYYMIKDRNEIE